MTQVIDFIGGEYRNRTGVHGFAIRCVTTPPTRHPWCEVGNNRTLNPLQERRNAFCAASRCSVSFIVARRVQRKMNQ